jgi:hypothetical protein
MTGIARKDVSRVRSLAADYKEDPRTHLSPLGDVLQQWFTTPLYLDKRGAPLALPFTGPKPSFEHLVHQSAGDLPAGALKVELIRVGAVEETDEGVLRVLRREIVPSDVDDRLFTSLAFSLKALATTVAYNTDPDRRGQPRIERFVQSGPLTLTSREELYQVVRNRVTAFTEEMDDLLSTGSITNAEEGRRVGIGVYFHEDWE